MNVKIRNEVELMDYFGGLIYKVVNLSAVEYVDAGDDVDAKVRNYLANNRIEKCTLFVGLYEGKTDFAERSRDGYLITGMLSVLQQLPDKLNATLLAGRTLTKEVLLNILGFLREDQKESNDLDITDYWKFELSTKDFLPSSNVGNANAYGWTVEFEIWIEVGRIVMKNVTPYIPQ